jgi:hypothetical protein
VLRAGARGGIYPKTHPDEKGWQDVEVVMLKEGTAVKEAITMAVALGEHSLGVIKKASAEQPRYGIRMRDGAKTKAVAEENDIGKQIGLGRYMISGIVSQSGPAGVVAMMASIAWSLDEVMYLEGDRAVVVAEACPAASKLAMERADGSRTVLHIKAMNKVARSAFKAKKIAFRTTDAEGDDVDNEEAKEKEAKELREKKVKRLQAEKNENRERVKANAQQPAEGSRRTRQPTGATPTREVRPKQDDIPPLTDVPMLPAHGAGGQ